MPTAALANGNWIGSIPDCLRQLTFAEKLLIARVRLNRCIVRFASSGMHKLRANAIAFQNPTCALYEILPPPRSDLEEILACIFTGPNSPTSDEMRRTPLLVRRNKVANALNWLKLNHDDYEKVFIYYIVHNLT